MHHVNQIIAQVTSTPRYLLAANILFLLFAKSTALSCYVCSSLVNCNDPFLATGIDRVDQLADDNPCEFCYKQKTVHFGSNTVERACMAILDPTNYQEGCFTQKEADGDVVTRCYCTKENCNTASSVVVSMVTIVIVMIIGKLLLM